MQTDMLTEVRKEQERLFSMINALKEDVLTDVKSSSKFYYTLNIIKMN